MSVQRVLTAAALATCAGFAGAGEIYLGAGLPGVMAGYAHPLNSSFTVRGDWATLGTRRKQTVEQGVNYDAELGFNRVGLFADWFYLGGLRITGGVTFNNLKANFVANGNGTPITIGNNQYPTTTDDRFTVSVEYPKTTPYLGLGYGHQASTGMGFLFDVGASFGKATLKESRSGPNLSLIQQSDVDAELAQLREGVGKIKFIPQVSIGLNYRF
jgi:hypothetical protein